MYRCPMNTSSVPNVFELLIIVVFFLNANNDGFLMIG